MRGLPALQGSDKSNALTAALAARPRPLREPAPPPLGFWQAFYRLWWQHEQPAPRDQRWMRWAAALISFLLHVLFALLLLWVAVVRWTPVTPSGGDGGRTQVAFVGVGVADAPGGEQGGAEPSAETAHDAAGSPATQPGVAAEPAASAAMDSTAMAPPAPSLPADQPLQVTEVEQATHAFVLPPPRVQVRPVVPTLRMPDVQVQSREVALADPAPTVARTVPIAEVAARVPVAEVVVRERQLSLAEAAPVVSTTLAAPAAPAMRQREMVVREREVQIAQAPRVELPSIPVADVGARVRTPEMAVRDAQVPMASAGRQEQMQTQVTDRAAANAAPAAQARAPQATPAAQGSGWDASARDDNWAAGRQSAEGAGTSGQGLFNADGSVRLAGDGAGPAGTSGAPGSEADTWTRDRLAQSGTWLKRPPYDYTPTSFDKYWVPNESLLAEWVRKGVKSIAIRIPGTSTTLSCKISLLQLGGGCGLDNPNMQEQPASARPPPDVPFKRELQEDNGSR